MVDYFLDFSITNINTVIERNHEQWQANNLAFANNYVMVICLDGKADYVLSDKTKLYAEKNRVLLFPPGNIRSGRADANDPWHFISINFDILFLNGTDNDLFNALTYTIDNVTDATRQKFIHLSGLWKKKGYMYKLRCRTIMQDILYELLNELKDDAHLPHYEKVYEVALYLRNNFTQTIAIKDLASIHQMSETHFRRLFRTVTGMSTKEYILKLRLDHATDLLRSGECNISEAALASGFNDVYYFSALFKKKYGYSPSKILHV